LPALFSANMHAFQPLPASFAGKIGAFSRCSHVLAVAEVSNLQPNFQNIC
jgi:hypothetical protein